MLRCLRSRGTQPRKSTTFAGGEQTMLFRTAAFLCLSWGAAVCPAKPDFQRCGRALDAAPADPDLVKALATIDPSRIEQTIQALVGFGTRNTSTSMDTGLPPGQGIEAAADWIAP